MRKLLVLGSLVATLAGTVGCQNHNWFRRGALFAPLQPASVVECPPVTATEVPMLDSACDACGPATTVIPPTTTYVPGPTG